MIHFLKAGTADIPLLRELTMKVWPRTYADILSQEQIDYMLDMMYSRDSLLEQMNGKHHQFIIGYEDEEPVAFASFSRSYEQDDESWKLHKIYILPEHQGKGLGKKIIDYIADSVRPLGAKSLELNVNRYNPAKSFYEKLGFVVTGTVDVDIGNGYFMNDYLMKLSLASR